MNWIIRRDELHQAWAEVTYRIDAESREDALIQIRKLKADGTEQVTRFMFDEFEVGEAVSIEDEENWYIGTEE